MTADIKASRGEQASVSGAAAPGPGAHAGGASGGGFAPHVILPKLHATSRRQALQLMIEAAREVAAFDPRLALDAALLRERLSGTGVGEGVAIPHARIAALSAPLFVFARLDPPVDFGAMDGLPADLALLLLTPADKGADHLKALAGASRVLRRPEIRERLRAARGTEGVMAVFEAGRTPDAA
jgi:PTS system nitrogen regulatory IIA component